jgi:hypothetical protein
MLAVTTWFRGHSRWVNLEKVKEQKQHVSNQRRDMDEKEEDDVPAQEP